MAQNENKGERISLHTSTTIGRLFPSGELARTSSRWYVTDGLPAQTDEDSPATPEAALTEIFSEVARSFYRPTGTGGTSGTKRPRFYDLGISHMRFHKGKVYELQIIDIECSSDYLKGLVGSEFWSIPDDVTIIFLHGWDKFVDIEGTIRVKGDTFEVFEAVSNLERTRKILEGEQTEVA